MLFYFHKFMNDTLRKQLGIGIDAFQDTLILLTSLIGSCTEEVFLVTYLVRKAA